MRDSLGAMASTQLKVLVGSILLATGGLIGIVAAIALGLNSMTPSCGTEPISATLSPDARLQVVVFEYDCGATTDFSTQVSVLPAGATESNQPGNVIRLDANGNAAPRGPGGGPVAAVKWVGSDSLEIRFDQRAQPDFQARTVRGVRIGYSFLIGHGA
jgi:hypothetical protein